MLCNKATEKCHDVGGEDELSAKFPFLKPYLGSKSLCDDNNVSAIVLC